MGVEVPIRFVANGKPIPRGDCDQCGRGPRPLAWTRDSLRICVECALNQCVECGGREGWHYAECSTQAAIALTLIEGRL